MSLNKETSGTLYKALNRSAMDALALRNYQSADLNERLTTCGVEAGEVINAQDLKDWIPGVELLARRVYRQRHRGHFGELTRLNQGVVAGLGFNPQQWASALMYAGTAKGFHIHPPYVPEGTDAKAWFQRLFIEEPENYKLREYDKEQWDMMFFVKGNVEFFLVDEREGMPRRLMRLIIDGDDNPGPNNVGLVIPPGVAHGLLVEGSEDLVMVYGTSTCFNPDFEGRLYSTVEKADPPLEWQKYF